MCDEETETENERYLRQMQLNRRQLAVGAGAAVATLLVGCGSARGPAAASTSPPADVSASTPPASAASEAKPGAPIGRTVTIETPDGSAEAFFVAPEGGRHPGVIIWPDVAGLRDAFTAMASRLAEEGYAVLAVNPYYRSSKMPILESFAEWRTDEGRSRIAPMREALSAAAVARDGAAFTAWLDQQAEVDTTRRIGTAGYCMGGPFTLRTAAAAPDRIGVIASFHGGGLVTGDADSPHSLLATIQAAALICVAQNDDERQPDAKSTLEEAARDAGLSAEIEVYPAQHGWCVSDSPVHDEAQAERAWARLLATFEAHL